MSISNTINPAVAHKPVGSNTRYPASDTIACSFPGMFEPARNNPPIKHAIAVTTAKTLYKAAIAKSAGYLISSSCVCSLPNARPQFGHAAAFFEIKRPQSTHPHKRRLVLGAADDCCPSTNSCCISSIKFELTGADAVKSPLTLPASAHLPPAPLRTGVSWLIAPLSAFVFNPATVSGPSTLSPSA